ncbi:hypothetical protein CRYUN_Cryun20dG0023500 [Craigia yunnanensis]
MAAVLSQAVKRGKEQGFDVVLCDTSGRLHTNYSLLEELRACKKAVGKVIPGAPIVQDSTSNCSNIFRYMEILLVLDGNTGLNMLPQAREFNEVVGITGFILTKLDGSARGGCVVSVVDELGIPVKFVGIDEGVEDLQPFDAEMAELNQCIFFTILRDLIRRDKFCRYAWLLGAYFVKDCVTRVLVGQQVGITNVVRMCEKASAAL